MGITDLELVNKFKSGNNQAFTELVNRYQHKIYNTTFRMLGNHDDALDIAQETFIRVYNNLKKFKAKSSFSTWLFTVTTNLCRDELRKRKNNLKTFSISNYEQEMELEDNYNTIKNNPEEISLNKELQKIIQKKIDQLQSDQKTVIILRDVQGLSYKEIAKILGISMGTVKSRLSRARTILRDDLKNIIEGGYDEIEA